MKVFAAGGDSSNSPSHSQESLMSAWVAGADWLMFRVQRSSDGVLVVHGNDDLATQTNANGPVSALTIEQLDNLDAGHAFSVNTQKPWRLVREPFEYPSTGRKRIRARIPRLDIMLRNLDERACLAVVLDGPETMPDETDAELATQVIEALMRHDFAGVTLVTYRPARLKELQRVLPKAFGLSLAAAPKQKLSEAIKSADVTHLNYLFCDGDCLDLQTEKVRVVGRYSDPSTTPFDNPPYGVETPAVLAFGDLLGHPALYFQENFPGKSLDKGNWVAGISGGFELPGRFILDANTRMTLVEEKRGVFDTRLYVDDGLTIDVREGNMYASAGAVTNFPVGGDFTVEVDWTYSNPQRATMCLLGITNSNVFDDHSPTFAEDGSVAEPNWQEEHQMFDTHGNPPFVAIEHEEADGTRIIVNRVGSGFYQWYNNFYPPNIGDGMAKEGSYRLQRRGRFFAGWYRDPGVNQWVGVGAHENASMNERVYIRMGGKHYPKPNAPNPLPANKIVFKNFRIYRRRAD